MKLAFVIIPHFVKGISTRQLIKNIIGIFFKEFGGCTHYKVHGVWNDKEVSEEPIECEKIEVAVRDYRTNKFLEIAETCAMVAGVEELMIQHPDGTIMFLKGAN